jgi:hypothetical protein
MSPQYWFATVLYISLIVFAIEIPGFVHLRKGPIKSPIGRAIVTVMVVFLFGTCLLGASYVFWFFEKATIILGRFLLFL